jgi:hypothetical protein
MVKVFSFCLYGPPNPRYYPLPMLENIWLVGTHFPEWKVYIYHSPDVDEVFLDQVAMYSNVVLVPTGKYGEINMIERFFAIDNEDVEIMFVRDADSHVHWKDRWAINDFLNKSDAVVHIIRDHVEHKSLIMGGMWGIRKSANIVIKVQYELFKEKPIDRGIGNDQSFLSTYVFPYVWSNSLVHYSNGKLLTGETGVQFPFEWTNEVYCGRCDGGNGKFIDYPQPPMGPEIPRETRDQRIKQSLPKLFNLPSK